MKENKTARTTKWKESNQYNLTEFKIANFVEIESLAENLFEWQKETKIRE